MNPLAIVFSRRAEKDLEEIWDYVAERDVDDADRLREEIKSAIRKLAVMPGIGHYRADVPSKRYRFWKVKKYILAYRYTRRVLTVARVVYGARDFRRLFRPRRRG